jgi:hypothetical protein
MSSPSMWLADTTSAIRSTATSSGTYRFVPSSAPPEETQPLTSIQPTSWTSPSRSPRKPLRTARIV